jgi:hypothetical protein
MTRDGHVCAYCGCVVRTVAEGASQIEAAHLDHLVCQSWYLSRGRRINNVATNLVATCPACNESRGDQPLGSWCRTVAGRRLGVDAAPAAVDALGVQIEKTIRAQARRKLPKAA